MSGTSLTANFPLLCLFVFVSWNLSESFFQDLHEVVDRIKSFSYFGNVFYQSFKIAFYFVGKVFF